MSASPSSVPSFDPSPEQTRVLRKWQVSTFWVMLLGYIGYYLGRQNLSAALPLISEEFQYTNTQLGMLMTFSELAYALGKFINGPIADKVGGKRIFLVGLAGTIVFNILFPQFSTLIMFTIIWCCCRFFLSMGWGGVIKTIGEWYPAEKNGTIMGLISVNFQFGGVAAALFTGSLLAMGVGWKGLFYFPAFVLIFVWLWSWLASKEGPREVYPGVRFGRYASQKKAVADAERPEAEKESILDTLQTLFKIPLFRHILVFSFITTFLRSIFTLWTIKFLVDIGMEGSTAVFRSAVFPTLGVLGTVLLGWYTDNYAKNGDRAKAMVVMLSGLSLSLLGIGLLSAYELQYQNLIVILVGLSGFFLYGPYAMSSGCLTLDVAGSKRAGSCTGIIDGIGYIGGALAVGTAGYLSDLIGWSEVFLFLSVISIFAIASAYRMSRTYKIIPKESR